MSDERAPTGRLLIVDNEDAIVRAIETYFSILGFSVTTARNVQEAEAALTAGGFHVVLTDLRMDSERDGLWVARRALETSPSPRVIVLTGYGTPQLEVEAREIGVYAVLHKPQPLASIARVVGPPGSHRDAAG